MKQNTHAIVIGGSIAGLLAARVLVAHFERVTVIDRDELQESATPRRGVPQGPHVHGFWPRGLDYVETILPGLRAGLLSGGASAGDATERMVWHHCGHLKAQTPVGIVDTLATRPLLESEVLRRVRAQPSIAFKQDQRRPSPSRGEGFTPMVPPDHGCVC